MQSSNEPRGGDTGQGPQHGEQDEHEQRIRIDRHRLHLWDVEGWRVAEEPATHERRRPRRDCHGKKCLYAHLGHHELDGEHHSADWRIEGGRDPGACTSSSDEGDTLTRRHTDYSGQM